MLAGGGALLFFGWKVNPFLDRGSPEPLTVVIAPGTSVQRVANVLEDEGAISSAKYFVHLVRWQGSGHIQAGEFFLPAGLTPIELLKTLQQGVGVQRQVVLPEGLSFRDMEKIFVAAGWPNAPAILADPDLPHKLDLPTNHIEGWLFPNTYYFRRDEKLLALLGRMSKQAKEVLDREWEGRDSKFSLSKYETLILASIIEKETGQGAERSRISGVFHNRLRKRMRLQTDPTVIYGIANFDGNITKKHLRTPTPYNTYTMRGLPPTPICNPGQAAINAALHPDKTKELYFVAKGDGTHAFAPTLVIHERNVTRYQRSRKARRKAKARALAKARKK